MRSPSQLKGYWNKPDATAAAIRDGWFHTGDIGLLDADGFLHFLGRRKEMLKVTGMSVFPAEIEAMLGRHPAVLGSGVIGRPDERRGQVPVAFIMLDPDRRDDLTETGLAEWCRANMATYKVPEIRRRGQPADDRDRQGEKGGAGEAPVHMTIRRLPVACRGEFAIRSAAGAAACPDIAQAPEPPRR